MEMDFDLGDALGAVEGASTQRLMLYIPNKDKFANEILEISKWVQEARALLGDIGGGSTAFPPADGTWIDDSGKPLFEETRMVFCFVRPDGLRANVARLREFLHRFGRETNQGEVVVEFDGLLWRLRSFDGR